MRGEPIIATVTTGSAMGANNSNYLFTGVPPGNYLVHVSDTNAVLIDFTKSPLGSQTADGTNKADPYPVNLATAAANSYTADFGYYQNPGPAVGVIGNQVWIESARQRPLRPAAGRLRPAGRDASTLLQGEQTATCRRRRPAHRATTASCTCRRAATRCRSRMPTAC